MITLFLLSILFCIFSTLIIVLVQARRKRQPFSVGFLHPFSESGGGGERVLWQMIHSLQSAFPRLSITLYTGAIHRPGSETEPPIELVDYYISIVKTQFNIEIQRQYLKIQPFYSRSVFHPANHPVMTLLSQSLASTIIAFELILSHYASLPPVLFETMGLSFCYPILKCFGGVQNLVPYVHYPTISSDMFQKVRQASGPTLKKRLKLRYYQLFSCLYSFTGRFADLVLTNSSWTHDHIVKAWPCHRTRSRLLYPPVAVEALIQNRSSVEREKWILSVSQFRPEKNHVLQIQAFDGFRKGQKERGVSQDWKLLLIGGVRNAEDQRRVAHLQALITELDLQSSVSLITNASHSALFDYYQKASIGIHTMREEHFGINIVEFMAAGLIPIAHDSGGPKLDILKKSEPKSETATRSNGLKQASLEHDALLPSDASLGFLCDSVEEYVAGLTRATELSKEQRLQLVSNCQRVAMERFSLSGFHQHFIEIIGPLIEKQVIHS